MNIYFNEKDEQYTALSQTIESPYFIPFKNSTHVVNMFKETQLELKSSSLKNSNIFFEKIVSITKYAYQINESLLHSIKNNLHANVSTDKYGNQMFSYNLISIDIDFNSFIYHTKSALDAFFNFIYDNFGKPTRAKRKALKMKKSNPTLSLSDFFIFELYTENHKDTRIKNIGKELTLLKPFLSNIVERGSKNSFRNVLTHMSTISQHTSSCFTCFKDTKGNALFIDADVYEYPLINTTNAITEAVTEFLLKALCFSINSKLISTINQYSFEVAHDCPFVNFRDYSDNQSTEPLQLLIFTDKGFTLNQEKVNKINLLKNTVEFKRFG